MLTIGLFPNTKKQGISTVLGWLIQYLQERKVQVLMPADVALLMKQPELGRERSRLSREINIALTLGGDGTLLSTVREVSPQGVPVCGINMGQLGFLTEIELPDLAPSVNRIIQGEYSLEDRHMLEAVIDRSDGPLVSVSALNDVVVAKGGFSRMIRLQLYINDHLTAHYPADGLIVATSTGSTGYSLSAGGPIVSPDLNVTIITPICPHSLNTRSLVVSAKEEIRIETQANHEDIMLTIDGQSVYHIQSGERIRIGRSQHCARFIKFSGSSFYDTLRTKLRRSDADDPT